MIVIFKTIKRILEKHDGQDGKILNGVFLIKMHHLNLSSQNTKLVEGSDPSTVYTAIFPVTLPYRKLAAIMVLSKHREKTVVLLHF